MKFLLVEHYVTLITAEQKEKYKHIVWDILQKSYESAGGFWTHKDPDELVELTTIWKLVRKNDKIIAAAVYRDKSGRKCVGMGSDRTLAGVEAVMGIMKEDQSPKLRRAWVEISPRLEKLWKEIGGRRLNSKLAGLILQTDTTPLDDFQYKRKVAGVDTQIKSAWGWPKAPELSLESTKFKILTNPNYAWKKRKKPKMPKVQKSIPDSDLCLQKGKSMKQAEKAYNDYRYRGKPYGVTVAHV